MSETTISPAAMQSTSRINAVDVVDGMVREYLVRKKCPSTSSAFDSERPTHARSLKTRKALIRALRISKGYLSCKKQNPGISILETLVAVYSAGANAGKAAEAGIAKIEDKIRQITEESKVESQRQQRTAAEAVDAHNAEMRRRLEEWAAEKAKTAGAHNVALAELANGHKQELAVRVTFCSPFSSRRIQFLCCWKRRRSSHGFFHGREAPLTLTLPLTLLFTRALSKTKHDVTEIGRETRRRPQGSSGGP